MRFAPGHQKYQQPYGPYIASGNSNFEAGLQRDALVSEKRSALNPFARYAAEIIRGAKEKLRRSKTATDSHLD